MLSYTEENYLKALFKISSTTGIEGIGTKDLADELVVKPSSVNEMLKKLKEKSLVDYKKYGKIFLTTEGKELAIQIVRRHRLWETFLYEKLSFRWDEVHEVAEELEHIKSLKLINKLDEFLDFPQFDPHGDPIPNEKGEFKAQSKKTLTEIIPGNIGKMVAVKDNSSSFLQYIVSLGLGINNQIKVISRQEYDGLTVIEVNGEQKSVSKKFTDNIYVV